MKQVIQNTRSGKLRVIDVPEPAVIAGHALVRTTASLISAGTERMVVDFARKTLIGKAQARPDLVRKVLDKVRRDGIGATLRSVRARLDEPLPLGYSAAGTIMALGAGLEGRFRLAQRVAMAGAGIANHAEINLVPQNLLAPIPDDVDDESAAFATLAAIAMHGCRNLRAGLGDLVAVLGAGLVGLLAIRLLVLAGARVVAIDRDKTRLDLARSFGAELTLDLADGALIDAAMALTAGRGVDAVLIAAADDTNAPLVLAAEIARDRARISLVGKVGTDFPFADYMKKELEIVVSRSYGPGRYDTEFEEEGVKYPAGFVRWTETANLTECLRLMSPARPSRLDVRSLISHRFPIDTAERAYELVMENREKYLGVLLTYPSSRSSAAPLPTRARATSDRCAIGVIGAGAFARAVLLPILKAMAEVDLRTVVTTRATAEHARTAFGFAQSACDASTILDDPAIDAVIIATPHGTHADLTARALAAGKSVFVEKPLALDRADLERVASARRGSNAFFTVGFNRRFAPMALKARARLATLPGPKLAVLRINSGPSPVDPEPGGRILGELCHFVDLARFLIGAPIRSVQAAAALSTKALDDVAVTLSFADGSVATIAYTGLGDTSDTKERIEVFSTGTVVRIEDFRHFTVVADGASADERDRLGQDKGHRNELAAFIAAVQGKASAPIDEDELVETSLATIAVVESLRAGTRIDL